jgi:flagella basal body P-ring formation protein FlgA
VKFEKASPIDITRIKKYVKNYYMQKYSKIDIKKVEVHPRTYIDFIGKKYIIEMPHKSELHKKGTLSIKLPNNKKIFFDFYIDATLPLYIAKKSLKRKEELSFRNTLKKSIILDKFKALPIQTIKKGTLQSKFHIQKGTVLTSRDVEIISLVKRKSTVNVTLHNSNMSISFSAQALQDGKYGDTISVRNANGKKIKVIVVGKNRVEIR